MLWSQFKVENFIFVLPSPNLSQYSIHEKLHRLVEMNNYCDIFSWFPYEANHCCEHFQAVRMGKYYMENGGEFSHNIQLFRNKIPNNFAGYTNSALVPSIEPYSVGVINNTDFQGQSVLGLRGVLD